MPHPELEYPPFVANVGGGLGLGALALAAAWLAGCTAASPKAAPVGEAGAANAPPEAPPAKRAPPPISGGTLLVTRDGRYAVLADPAADAVHVVGIRDDTPGCEGCGELPRLLAGIGLPEGEEPGRLAEDGDGRVQVALRKGGAVATIDLSSGALLARRPVCPEPRGIAYEAATDLLHVACASGELVSLSPASGAVQRRVSLDVDLRDVVVVPDGLVVSRFKTAELITVGADGVTLSRILPARVERGPQDLAAPVNDLLEPAVAWRAASTPDGTVVMLHQYGVAGPIDIGKGDASTSPTSPYGGRACGGIVAQTVSTLLPDGRLDMGMPLSTQALSVDLAVSSDGAWLAVAHPGALATLLSVYAAADVPSRGRAPVHCANPTGTFITQGRPVSVAFLPGRTPGAVMEDDWLAVQTRAPDAFELYRGFGTPRVVIPLGTERDPSPGHDLFHTDSGRGIACAQCHPEGGEDGRVWRFLGVGARRTQPLHVGLRGTEPFHWSGDLADFAALVADTFVHRMGGAAPRFSELEALETWVFGLRPLAPKVERGSAAAVRGRALFESPGAGCSGCHDGPGVKESTSLDVGTASPEAFQIPPLRGVGYRAPFLHDGRATTLPDRFDPSLGGGDRHGVTSNLAPAEIDDLISYLESL